MNNAVKGVKKGAAVEYSSFFEGDNSWAYSSFKGVRDVISDTLPLEGNFRHLITNIKIF